MVRYWTVGLLLLAVAGFTGISQGGGKDDKDLVFKGQLTKDDPRDRKRNAAFKAHTVRMKAGSTYTIDMTNTPFDNYLRLEDAKGKELAEDDDSGGMQNARIIFNCQTDGEYKIICTAYAPEGVGGYVLTVKKSGVAPKLSTPHAAVVGKPAIDLEADFALNGKVLKLADLKGKVVLVDFWAVWSPQSVATLEKLRAWHKAHKEAGLEIVGVTFYNYENGQYIGFDKSEGTLTKLESSNKATEQTMLKDFAAFYKLDYLLLVQSKDAALKTFNEYVVNGMPQSVLIDRQGVVRHIMTGDRSKYADNLESEIKKLLAEK